MTIARSEQYGDHMARLYPELFQRKDGDEKRMAQSVTFQVTDDCNLSCHYCLSGDTQIRMADYSLKSIKDVELGDEILGYEEYPEKGKQTKVIKATVDQLFQRNSKVLNMRFSTGESIQITPNHKILVRRNSHDNRYDYMEADKLKPGDSVYYLPIIDKNFDIVYPNFDRDYKIGYLIAMIQGDGSLKHYNRKNDGCDVFKFRIAVKDIEIIERCKSYLDDLNIPVYLKPFKVSEKHNLWQNAIFSNMRYTYNSLKNLIEDHFQKTKSVSYYQGYLAGIYDAEGHISKERVIRICNTDYEIIKEIAEGLDLLKIPYIIECDNKGTVNKDKKFNVRITDNLNAISSYRFIKSVSPSIPRKCFEQFLNYAPLKKAKIISITESGTEVPVYNIGTSSHTYIANGIAVHNCYQINKGKRRMSLETAKKFVDLLLDSTPENNSYINPEKSPFIILDFIGGEPLLEVDLIDEIVTYFMEETFNRMHPWADRFRVSLCSNGVLYFEPNVQRFLKKHRNHLSLSITIDGNQELHDSCRVFHDGRPSYDLAVAAAKDWMDNYGDMGSKITIAPENIEHVYEALVHMVELGYTEINANCVFEEGWEREHAIELYAQMKRFADYLIDNDLQDTIYCSLFEEVFFKPMPDERNDNWCGGTGVMLSCDPDGYLYPCIRYMESSLGEEQPPIRIGHVDTGLVTTEEEKQTVKCLKCITRRSQSTDECYYCPIADGCAWCFPAGTKVSTPDGLVNIEELKTGDMVLDKDGNTQRVYRNLERKNDGLVYVKAAGLYDLLTTKEHPFWCKSVIKRNNNIPTYGDPRWVPAGNLKTEDRIALFVPKPGDEDVDKNYAYLLGHNFAHRQSEYVSRSLWNWNLDSIKAFLRGIFDTDKRFEKSQDSMRLLSASLELTLNISELVRMVYHVNVSIRKHEVDNMYECVWEPDVSSTREYYDFDERNNIMWVNVSPSKKDVPAEATVFNLSVENNPTFIANGAIVHNCSAYNYQVFGTVDKRATFICEMHKARSLANVYFWNKVYEKESKDKKFPMHCPKEWAIPIIGEKEYSYLLKLSEGGNHEDQNR